MNEPTNTASTSFGSKLPGTAAHRALQARRKRSLRGFARPPLKSGSTFTTRRPLDAADLGLEVKKFNGNRFAVLSPKQPAPDTAAPRPSPMKYVNPNQRAKSHDTLITRPEPSIQRQSIYHEAFKDNPRIVKRRFEGQRKGIANVHGDSPLASSLETSVEPLIPHIRLPKRSYDNAFIKTFIYDQPAPSPSAQTMNNPADLNVHPGERKNIHPWPSPRFEHPASSTKQTEAGYFSAISSPVSIPPFNPSEGNVLSVAVEISAANRSGISTPLEKATVVRRTALETPGRQGTVVRRHRKSTNITEEDRASDKLMLARATPKIFDFRGDFDESDESDVNGDFEMEVKSSPDEEGWVGKREKYWDQFAAL